MRRRLFMKGEDCFYTRPFWIELVPPPDSSTRRGPLQHMHTLTSRRTFCALHALWKIWYFIQFVRHQHIQSSVQAEFFLSFDPTFLEVFDPMLFHMLIIFTSRMMFACLPPRPFSPFALKIGQNNNSVTRAIGHRVRALLLRWSRATAKFTRLKVM